MNCSIALEVNIAMDTLTKLLLIAPEVTWPVFTLVHWGYGHLGYNLISRAPEFDPLEVKDY